MKTTHQLKTLWLAAGTGLLALAGSVNAQIITYQGLLSDRGEPAEGAYDLKFQFRQPGPPPVLFDPPIILPAVLVSGGRFTVPLDTTGVPVGDRSPLELVVCVRRAGEPNFVPLDPPQAVTPAPRALAADVAGSVPIGGLPPSVVQDDVAPFFGVPLTAPQLILPDPNSILRFGPFGDCTIGVDPDLPGLTETDPTGFRLLGQNGQGCRLIFGPTMDCTVEVDPTGPAGLLLRDPNGVRILNPDPTGATGPTLRFGPTDDCTIGLDPELPGIVERDPTGFRLLGQDSQGCRLIFGPTMDCTVEVDPTGPAGLLLRDPNGIRIVNPVDAASPLLLFGPTDDCTIGLDPQRGLFLKDPRGITIPFTTDPAGQLLPAVLTMGDVGECRWRVNAPNTGPRGMILEDPEGLLLVNPAGGAGSLSFGESGECRLRVGELPNQKQGLIIDDPGGVQFNSPDSFFDIIHVTEIIQTSTRRLKDNIQRIEEPLDKIRQLEGVTFDWKPERGGQPAIGFIAEEVGKVFPEVVAFEENGVNATGMNYGHLVAVTVEGIKAQQDQIDDLEKENNELRESVADMQAQMKALSAQLRALSAQ